MTSSITSASRDLGSCLSSDRRKRRTPGDNANSDASKAKRKLFAVGGKWLKKTREKDSPPTGGREETSEGLAPRRKRETEEI